MTANKISDQIDRNEVEEKKLLGRKKTRLFGRRDMVMDSIALSVVLGFFAMAFLVAITPRDNTDHDVLNILIGQLSAGFICVLSFFFGSIRKP
jgi:hypothetical protein